MSGYGIQTVFFQVINKYFNIIAASGFEDLNLSSNSNLLKANASEKEKLVEVISTLSLTLIMKKIGWKH